MLGTVRATVTIPPHGQPRLQPSHSYTTTTTQQQHSSSWRVQTRPSGSGGGLRSDAAPLSYGYGPARSTSQVQHASTVELDRLIDELMNISSTEQVAVITSPGQNSQPHWLTMLKTRVGGGGTLAPGAREYRDYRDYMRDYRQFERSATTSRIDSYARKMSSDSNASNTVSTWNREYVAPLFGQSQQQQPQPPPQPPPPPQQQSPHHSRSATAYARTYSYTTRPSHSHPARYVEQLTESERRLLEELRAQRMRPQPPPPQPPQPTPPPRPPPPSAHNYSSTTASYSQQQRSEWTGMPSASPSAYDNDKTRFPPHSNTKPSLYSSQPLLDLEKELTELTNSITSTTYRQRQGTPGPGLVHISTQTIEDTKAAPPVPTSAASGPPPQQQQPPPPPQDETPMMKPVKNTQAASQPKRPPPPPITPLIQKQKGMKMTERKEQQQVELLEEVETIALCPIGRGVVDLDPGVGAGGPGDMRSLSGTLRRGRSYTPAHYMSQQLLAQAGTLPASARLVPPGAVPYVKSATARSFQGGAQVGSMTLQHPPPRPPVRSTPPRQLPPNAQLTPFPPLSPSLSLSGPPPAQQQQLLSVGTPGTMGMTNTFSRMQQQNAPGVGVGPGPGPSPGAPATLNRQQTSSYEYSYVTSGPGTSPGAGYQNANAQFANTLPPDRSMAMRAMPAPASTSRGGAQSQASHSQANGAPALNAVGAQDVSVTMTGALTPTPTQQPPPPQTQLQMQSPQAAIDSLIDAMDRFTAATSSQQQAAYRPSGAATLGPRPQQQQLSGDAAVNEGFVTYQRVDKQQAVRNVDGHQINSSARVYTDHNENEVIPTNTAFLSENEIAYGALKVVKDTANWWYKPKIARDDVITILKNKPEGSFLVRDSNTFFGSYGLAVKVERLPPNVKSKSVADPTADLVRHFLIEPTSRGVRIKGCSNEPEFATLAALVYQHTVSALALPCKLRLPEFDLMTAPGVAVPDGALPNSQLQQLDQQTRAMLEAGMTCATVFVGSCDVEKLTGPNAIAWAATSLRSQLGSASSITDALLRASLSGVLIADVSHKLFTEKSIPTQALAYAGIEPNNRRWNEQGLFKGLPNNARIFGLVVRKQLNSDSGNVCYLFAEVPSPIAAAGAVTTLDVSLFARFIQRYLLPQTN